jgi:hypothetical protein
MLKCISEKYGVITWIGFNWLWIGTVVKSCAHSDEPSCFIPHILQGDERTPGYEPLRYMGAEMIHIGSGQIFITELNTIILPYFYMCYRYGTEFI